VRKNLNVIAAYSIMMGLIILVGIFQSWNIALSIFNLCLISAVMTMGANIQWGYAGLINFGIMGIHSTRWARSSSNFSRSYSRSVARWWF
jgi:branched-chain amino acid transport system permease protein